MLSVVCPGSRRRVWRFLRFQDRASEYLRKVSWLYSRRGVPRKRLRMMRHRVRVTLAQPSPDAVRACWIDTAHVDHISTCCV